MGYEITQLACGFPGAASRERMDGMTVRRLGALPLYYPRVLAATARETRRGRFDVVVEHLNKLPFCAKAYSAAPVIAVNHHLFGSSAFLQVPWAVAASVVSVEKLIPWVYRDVSFLAVSESSRQDLVGRGIPREAIDLLYNGITFPTQESRPMAERPLRIAYLGRLEPYKRVDLLLRAVAALVSRFPGLELVVVGRGVARESLEALAAELGLAARVRFTGFVDDAERDATVADARVCVCPSVKEGWGITVIEANALGVPVVATDAPGLRDAVLHGETGLLVPCDDHQALAAAIQRLGATPALVARLAAGGRAAYETGYTEQAVVERYLRLFESLSSGSALGRGQLPGEASIARNL